MNLLSVKDAAAQLSKSCKTLYCLSSRDKARKIDTRFVWIDGRVLVNIDAFEDGKIYVPDAVTQKTQEEFEKLWFYLIERQTRISIYEIIATCLNKKSSAVRGYFYDVFLGGTETTKNKYVEIMREISKKHIGVLA